MAYIVRQAVVAEVFVGLVPSTGSTGVAFPRSGVVLNITSKGMAMGYGLDDAVLAQAQKGYLETIP
jgi:hypothetical protein